MPSEPREPDSDLQRGFEPLRTIFAILVLLLGFAASARAQTGFGAMHASGADGAAFELATLSSDVQIDVSGLVAEARMRQRFSNHSTQWIEVQYLLPLPHGAAVHAMTVRIGERRIVAEIEEKEQARTRYVEAAASGRRAALVEKDHGHLFRTALANIAPGETIEVDVHWWQMIDWRDDRFTLTLPLTYTPRYRSPGASGTLSRSTDAVQSPYAPRVSIRAEVDAGLALSRMESPSHAIVLTKTGHRRTVTLADGDAPADRDFVLEWAPLPGQAPASALLTEQRGGETYALMMLLPRAELAHPLPRELVLVIDTSGSMEGQSMQQARAALDLALAALGPQDRFNVIQFNSTTEALFDAPVPARADDVRLAREWVAGLRADGGTEMLPALRRAFAGEPAPGYLRQVVFATDGAIDDARALYDLIDNGLGASRLFTIGIGSAPNAQFIERAATLGRGRSIVIRSTFDIGVRMRELFDALDRPALRDLSLQWPDLAETWPQRLPDLYSGEPLMVVARLPRAHGTLLASGMLANAPWKTSLPLNRGASAPGIARLWAQRKIEHLLQSLERGGDADTVRETVLTLALEHDLVTPYTSLVATEKTPARALEDDLLSQRIANGMPAGSLAFAATATTSTRNALFGLALLGLAVLCARPRRSPNRRSCTPVTFPIPTGALQ